MRQLDIRSICKLLLAKWRILLICALIGAILLGGFAFFFMEERYTTGVSMYVSGLVDAAKTQSADSVTAEWLVPTYVDVLENPSTLEQVLPKLSRKTTVEQLAEMISLTGIADTAILRITATANDAAFAAEVCNAMAEAAPYVLESVAGAGAVKVVGEALPGTKASPNVPLMAVIGLLCGLIAAVVIVVVRHLTDNTVKTAAGLIERLQVPVLGVLPSFEQISRSHAQKGGNKHG